MKPRERVQIALNHQLPDRCPLQVHFTPEFATRLRQDYRIQSDGLVNPYHPGRIYDLERAVGSDLLLTSVGWSTSYYQDGEEYCDEWGVGWKSAHYNTPYGVGRYTEICAHPLADENTILGYHPPDPTRPQLYEEAAWVVRTFGQEYWIVGVSMTTIFETAWALRGFERLLADFSLDPDRAEAVLEIPYRYHLETACRLARLGVDMIWLGDDVGAQQRMIISPTMWRRFLKPRMAELIAALKDANPCIKIAYHSDGMIEPIIPDLIEIGLDVLNPLQPASMDPARIKAHFGHALCFWGTLDEQHTLPFGSPDMVRREVLDRLNTVGRGGGLILAPSHRVQLDTPLENFWAMVDTVTRTPYQRYGSRI